MQPWDFNPRTPRGVRLISAISSGCSTSFQSTHPARGATNLSHKLRLLYIISIHAPREGCDGWPRRSTRPPPNFNPRTPRGVRRATTDQGMTPRTISIHAPREGCDGWLLRSSVGSALFQSTHPARGATASAVVIKFPVCHFNPHTPRGVRPDHNDIHKTPPDNFNPHTPRGVRPVCQYTNIDIRRISIHAPREGCDRLKIGDTEYSGISIHAPREGCDR